MRKDKDKDKYYLSEVKSSDFLFIAVLDGVNF